MMGDYRVRRSSAPENGNDGGNAVEFDRLDGAFHVHHQQIEEEESSWKSEAQFNSHASVDNSNDKIYYPKRIK
ncbi:hypothetical protein Tco_1170206, partial [Tanacetum coccineum]